MLNQAAVDALCSATYLENYLDCVEDLPNDLQRIVSMLRELDCLTNETMTDIKRHHEMWQSCDTSSDSTGASAERKRLATTQLQRSLGRMQEIGDQKLALVAEIMELIEGKTRQIDQSLDNLTNVGTIKEEEVSAPVAAPAVAHTRQATSSASLSSVPVVESASSSTASPATSRLVKTEEKVDTGSAVKSSGKRQKRQRNQVECASLEREEKKMEEEEKVSRKKKAKKEKSGTQSPVNNKATIPNVDPNEPVYCLCQQVSYGEMIGCDNEHCQIEWFHFNCVRLTHKPKGKWYCPRCRGNRPNIMNPELAEQQKRSSEKTGNKRGAD
jgi:inhibitor-of-growth protein 1